MQLVDQTDRERLVGIDESPREDQVLGLGWPDQPGQPLRAARPGDDAEQDLGLTELGVVSREAYVGRQGHLAATAEREAVIAEMVGLPIAANDRVNACSRWAWRVISWKTSPPSP